MHINYFFFPRALSEINTPIKNEWKLLVDSSEIRTWTTNQPETFWYYLAWSTINDNSWKAEISFCVTDVANFAFSLIVTHSSLLGFVLIKNVMDGCHHCGFAVVM